MRSIFRRIAGVALMIRALTPLFLLAVLLTIGLLALGPIRRIGESVDAIRASIGSVKTTFEEVRDEVAVVSAAAQEVSDAVDAVSDAVHIDLDTITVPNIETRSVTILGVTFTAIRGISLQQADLDLSLEVPGIQELKAMTDVLRSLGNALGELTGVVAVTAEVGAIANEFRAIGRRLGRVFGLGNARRGLRVIKWIVLLLVFSWFISYLANLARQLRRGWTMVRGLPDPG